ncbi:MAG TPA: penicillin-binding transpeptidase domain-containing protein [Kofleriaceae bacterium]|nr:penicillin-binding transpeptidase domain-containing protein [Kofleriaceae bacterium]
MQTGRKLATTLSILTLLAAGALIAIRGGTPAAAAPSAIAAALPRPPEAGAAWKKELSFGRVREDADGYVQMLKDGGRVELTLDPTLQRQAERILEASPTPYAAAVMISVEDGRVLALAGRSGGEPHKNAPELALKAWAPAASVFKLVTAAALVDAGVSETTRVCYHDGVHSVESSNLVTHPRWDRACRSLAFGVAKSQNAIMARLANDHLDAGDLERTARALGFGAALPFELPVEPSEAEIPHESPLAFARVAAGFWSTTLSPLHGAYLAATLARGGVTPPLRIIDRVVDRAGDSVRPDGAAPRRVISADAAQAVARMMVGTTQYGTAKSGFHDRRGRPLLPGVAVAGKTGSLNRVQPFLAYSWFVGFAPAERPEVAVAVLLGNGTVWHRRAHQVAAEMLSGYFHGDSAPAPSNHRLASR